jgi:predicted transcriptional regulator
MKRRGWIDISIDILESAKTPKAKTRIMYKANLNFAQFNVYFNDFLRKGLLEETSTNYNKTFVTSERGRTLLAALREAERLFSEVPAQNPLCYCPSHAQT